MKDSRAIIFDLDDTLYPERDYVLSGFRAVARWAHRHLGIPVSQGFVELREMFREGIRGDTFDRWLSARGLHADGIVSILVGIYRSHEPRISHFPDVPKTLESLHNRFRLGLLSDGDLKTQELKLAALNLANHFDAIVFTDAFGKEFWKPHPRGFEVIAYQLGLSTSEAIYVGDNPLKDFVGARKAGLRSIRVRYAQGVYARLEPHGPEYAPDVEILAITELPQALYDFEKK